MSYEPYTHSEPLLKITKTEYNNDTDNYTIQSVDDLKEYFLRKVTSKKLVSKTPLLPESKYGITVYVSSKIRKEWLLSHESTIIAGTVFNICFKDIKGGVWEASLCPK